MPRPIWINFAAVESKCAVDSKLLRKRGGFAERLSVMQRKTLVRVLIMLLANRRLHLWNKLPHRLLAWCFVTKRFPVCKACRSCKNFRESSRRFELACKLNSMCLACKICGLTDQQKFEVRLIGARRYEKKKGYGKLGIKSLSYIA